MHVGIRPEDMSVVKDSESESVPVKVALVEPIGSDTLLSVEVSEDVSCKVRVPASFQVVEGDHIKIKIQTDKIHLFDDEGIRVTKTGE